MCDELSEKIWQTQQVADRTNRGQALVRGAMGMNIIPSGRESIEDYVVYEAMPDDNTERLAPGACVQFCTKISRTDFDEKLELIQAIYAMGYRTGKRDRQAEFDQFLLSHQKWLEFQGDIMRCAEARGFTGDKIGDAIDYIDKLLPPAKGDNYF